jgi:hypothetical protein
MRMTMSDPLLQLELLLCPFRCLDAKGGEESIYLAIYLCRSLLLFGFGL